MKTWLFNVGRDGDFKREWIPFYFSFRPYPFGFHALFELAPRFHVLVFWGRTCEESAQVFPRVAIGRRTRREVVREGHMIEQGLLRKPKWMGDMEAHFEKSRPKRE